MNFLYPVPKDSIITQTYDQHIQRAKDNGWCYSPDGNCSRGYYYGGIDWGVQLSTPVRAAQSGIANCRNDKYGYGIHVRLQHEENYMSIYGHLSKYIINTGDKVSAGDIIGYSGNTGNSTGPHLHFEIRLNGVPINPALLLSDDIIVKEKINLPEFPKLPKYRVIATPSINIRNSPGIKSTPVGSLKTGSIIQAMDGISNEFEAWLKIGINQWIALCYNSIYLLESLDEE